MRGWTLLAVAIQEFLLHGSSYAPVSYGNNSSRRSNYGKYNNHGNNNNMNESSAIMDKLQNYLLAEFKFSSRFFFKF
jgi:hypothetical protein